MRTDFSTVHQAGSLQRKSFLRRFIVTATIAIAVCFPEFVGATHLIGGNLTYRCLGNNMYEITLTYRRDCALGAPGTEYEPRAHIGFFNLKNNQLLTFIPFNGVIQMPRVTTVDTLMQGLIDDCTLAANDLCIEETTYRDTIQLSFFADGYRLVYQRCCRNMSLTNVLDPLNTGMTLEATITAQAQMECNNSPNLGPFPPIYICVDRDFDFDFAATDPDGDSLVYELYSPNLGATNDQALPTLPSIPPYDTVVWLTPPYSIHNLLGGVPLQIDRFTGLMTARPSTIGQFLVAVRILSYRNGQLIETTTREWQFNVRPCEDAPMAAIDTSNLLNCSGLSVDFMHSATNAEEYFWVFDTNDINSPTSNQPNPMFMYPNPGTYTVSLVVSDSMHLCFDTTYATVGVYNSGLTADFNVAIPKCDMPIIIQAIDVSAEPDPGFEIVGWEYVLMYGDESDTSNLQFPLFSLDTSYEDVVLTLTVTSSNGCTATVDTTFDANILFLDFKGDSVGLCLGDSVELFNNPGGDFTYIWNPTEGLDLTDSANPIAFPAVTTEYFVTVTDGLCSIEDSVTVAIIPLPTIAFVATTDCRSLDVFLENNSTGINYLWDFGDNNKSTEEEPEYTYQAPGTYTITLFSDDGCDVSASQNITVSVIDDEVEGANVSCFSEPVVLNAGGNTDYMYLWSPSEFLDNDTLASPTADIDVTTVFYVTISDTTGCFVVDSLLLREGEDFDFAIPNDSAYCETPPFTLIGSNPDLDYVWYDAAGNEIFVGPSFTVTPTEETSYIVTGTDSLGCVKTDTVTLSPTVFDITTMTEDTVICLGDTVQIAVINNDPSQELMYQWSPENLIIPPSNVSNPLVSPELDQTYYVTVTNGEVGCTTTDSVSVRVSNFRLEYAPSLLICRFDTLVIGVSNGDTTDLNFVWGPMDEIIAGGDGPNPRVSPEETTEYCATVTDNYGCQTEICVLVNVSWFEPEELEIMTDFDTVFLGDTVFHLTTNQDDFLDYFWEGHPGIEPVNGSEVTVTPNAEGPITIFVTVQNEDECALTGSINLFVIDPPCDENTVFVPDAFSPNGDGFNDDFRVYSIPGLIEDFEIHIYNRWGQEVYKSFDEMSGWDGTFENDELVPEVFGYYLRVVCVPNKPYFTKGNVTLFR